MTSDDALWLLFCLVFFSAFALLVIGYFYLIYRLVRYVLKDLFKKKK